MTITGLHARIVRRIASFRVKQLERKFLASEESLFAASRRIEAVEARNGITARTDRMTRAWFRRDLKVKELRAAYFDSFDSFVAAARVETALG